MVSNIERSKQKLLVVAGLSAYCFIPFSHHSMAQSCLGSLCSGDGLVLEQVDLTNVSSSAAGQVVVPAVRPVSSLYTSQEPVNFSKRLRVLGPQVAEVRNGQLLTPVEFFLDANYLDFIRQWELEIAHVEEVSRSGEVRRKVIKRFSSDQLIVGQPIQWRGDILNSAQSAARNLSLSVGDRITYRLKVTDQHGNVDTTTAREIILVGASAINGRHAINAPDAQNWLQLMGKNNDLQQDGINLPNASLVRYHFEDINPNDDILIDRSGVKAAYPAGGKDNLVIERLYSPGEHQSQVAIRGDNGVVDKAVLPVSVGEDYFFMVALADITVGKNSISRGSGFSPASSEYRYYDGGTYTDGRLAFYLKGKIKGETLITAQMDTGTGELSELFKGIHEKDRRAIFRRIDPDKYYPVYGDDSTITRDVDTAGKLYVRIERDKSQFLWGNYNTGISGNSLADYNRSLYGAKGTLAGSQTVANGESRLSLTAFAAEPDTLAAQDRIAATGGSLYYLKHQDLALGSAKVVKVFLDAQGFERERITLTEGGDYDINEYQGRILLKRPFAQINNSAGQLTLNERKQAILVVDYEYVPSAGFSNLDQLTAGARAKGWINDQIGIGATYINEQKSGSDYELMGADITYRVSEDTYLRAEYAQSEGNTVKEINQSGFITNTVTGGLGYATLNSSTVTGVSGSAYRLEGRLGLSDYTNTNGYLQAWYARREAGFANTSGIQLGSTLGGDRTDYGAAINIDPTDQINLQARFERTETDPTDTQKIGAQINYKPTEKLALSAQVINEQVDNNLTGLDKDRTTIGAQASYQYHPNHSAYLNAKGVVDETNWGDEEGSIGIGFKGRISDRLSYNADYNHGLGGNSKDSVKVGFGYDLTDNHNVYANLSANLQDGGLSDGALTIGQKATVSDKLSLYSEHQFRRDNNGRTQQVNTFGGDYVLTDHYRVGLSYGQNDGDNASGQSSSLKSASLYGNYDNSDNLSFGNRIEWREEHRASSSKIDQIVLTNNLKYKYNEDFRLMGKANFSQTREQGKLDAARFAEIDLGVAYRPVDNNKLNLLGMYRYSYNRDPLSQTDAQYQDERSHILSVEGIYEIDEQWEVGAKVAHKQASYKPRGSGEWQDYNTSLGVIRLRYHMMHNWDALAEYRYRATSNPANSQDVHGGLVAVERHIGEHIKLGVGYNFANINDDLVGITPNQSSDVSGWFINLVGKY